MATSSPTSPCGPLPAFLTTYETPLGSVVTSAAFAGSGETADVVAASSPAVATVWKNSCLDSTWSFVVVVLEEEEEEDHTGVLLTQPKVELAIKAATSVAAAICVGRNMMAAWINICVVTHQSTFYLWKEGNLLELSESVSLPCGNDQPAID